MRNVQRIEQLTKKSKILTSKNREEIIEYALEQNWDRLTLERYVNTIEQIPTRVRLDVIRTRMPIRWIEDGLEIGEIYRTHQTPIEEQVKYALLDVFRDLLNIQREKNRRVQEILCRSV